MAKTAPKKTATKGVLSLKITLKHIKPPVWRRILVHDSMTLADLSTAIQIVMGWDAGHLHDFDIGGDRYGDPSITEDVSDESRKKLSGLIRSGVTRFAYTYDFGDNWEHDILIEKVLPANAPSAWPACLAGKRHCPPEDCGGPWGYADLLDILANPEHPDHEEQSEWLGDDFDPEAFSVAAADATLATVFRRNEPPEAG